MSPKKGTNSILNFVHKSIAVIFGKQHYESNVKLPIQLLSASANQCC